MNFQRDLVDIVKGHFSQQGISYSGSGDADDLAARYFEILLRRIAPVLRCVHFSDELHTSLGNLARTSGAKQRKKALEAWNAVFHIRYIMGSGGDLTPYQGKGIMDATSKDGLLWDYGMHHFHLGSGFERSGFARRSDYLLFAIVADEDAFLVDVRSHRDPEGLQWVRQDLLKIVHRNWPEITNERILRGIQWESLTDEQKKELRRKNVNTVADMGDYAITPLGWGTMADGSSAMCKMRGYRLLHELKWHEEVLSHPTEEIRAHLEGIGVAPRQEDFRLVLLNSVDATPDLADHLQQGDHQSRGLYAAGFAIVEASNGHPVVISAADAA